VPALDLDLETNPNTSPYQTENRGETSVRISVGITRTGSGTLSVHWHGVKNIANGFGHSNERAPAAVNVKSPILGVLTSIIESPARKRWASTKWCSMVTQSPVLEQK
jgi:hypothetical protein